VHAVSVFLSAKPATKPFNADFYATTATIIPVFMLAFTVGVLRNAGILAWAKWAEKGRGLGRTYRLRVAIVLVPAVLPLCFALSGEEIALNALVKRQNQTGGGDPLIVAAILAMAFIIFIGSLYAIANALREASGRKATPPQEPPEADG
jgi:hypothetical protein